MTKSKGKKKELDQKQIFMRDILAKNPDWALRFDEGLDEIQRCMEWHYLKGSVTGHPPKEHVEWIRDRIMGIRVLLDNKIKQVLSMSIEGDRQHARHTVFHAAMFEEDMAEWFADGEVEEVIFHEICHQLTSLSFGFMTHKYTWNTCMRAFGFKEPRRANKMPVGITEALKEHTEIGHLLHGIEHLIKIKLDLTGVTTDAKS